MNTNYKPNLKKYGSRKKLYISTFHILVFVCLITPFTNWLIPILSRIAKGKIYFIFEK